MLLEAPNVCQAAGAAQCDVKTPFPPIWYCSEQLFQLGAHRIQQEVEGANRTAVSLRIPARHMAQSTLVKEGT